MISWQIMLENKAAQEDPLEIREVLFQIADFVDVAIKETRIIAQPTVNSVQVVVRETILLRNAAC